MEKNNIAIIIKRFLSGRFPEKTEERVQRWIIADENTKEKEAASLEYWNELNTEINSDTYSALKQVNQRIGYTKSQTAYIPYHQKLLRIAAVLIPMFIMAGGYLYYTRDKLIEISVAYGETRHLFLPDSSEIWINSGSSIKYPKVFTDDQRQIYLKGEAYFSVKKNPAKPFIVKTEPLSVKVLGTKFNVKAYPGDENVTTTLTSGKVEVFTSLQESQILRPNEQLTYNINTSAMNIEQVLPVETDAWLVGQILFINSSFNEIKQTLERHFNVTIDDKTAISASRSYTVKFLKGETLTEILDVLKDVVGFTYRQQGEKIVLSK